MTELFQRILIAAIGLSPSTLVLAIGVSRADPATAVSLCAGAMLLSTMIISAVLELEWPLRLVVLIAITAITALIAPYLTLQLSALHSALLIAGATMLAAGKRGA